MSLCPPLAVSWVQLLQLAQWPSLTLTGKKVLGDLDRDPYFSWKYRARQPRAASSTYLVMHELEIDPFQSDLQQATLTSFHVLHRELAT